MGLYYTIIVVAYGLENAFPKDSKATPKPSVFKSLTYSSYRIKDLVTQNDKLKDFLINFLFRRRLFAMKV